LDKWLIVMSDDWVWRSSHVASTQSFAFSIVICSSFCLALKTIRCLSIYLRSIYSYTVVSALQKPTSFLTVWCMYWWQDVLRLFLFCLVWNVWVFKKASLSWGYFFNVIVHCGTFFHLEHLLCWTPENMAACKTCYSSGTVGVLPGVKLCFANFWDPFSISF